MSDEKARFAILSMRLLLSFEPLRESTRSFEAEQVAGYMRVAYSVPLHREYMRSGSSSEPILAEAAAQLMNATGVGVIRAFSETMNDDLIRKGDRGEEVARLLLTLAHDLAVKAAYDESRYTLDRGAQAAAEGEQTHRPAFFGRRRKP
jgi:hypothetical protein